VVAGRSFFFAGVLLGSAVGEGAAVSAAGTGMLFAGTRTLFRLGRSENYAQGQNE
jgi:hypothetical protein